MIEEVSSKHLDFIVNLLKNEFNTNYSKNEYVKEYVYILNNEIVGFIIYEYIYDRIELDYIYVLPNYRNLGIASKLMTQMIDFSCSVNSLNITLEVNENNLLAIELYKKFNFEICAKREKYYHNDSAYLMIRK